MTRTPMGDALEHSVSLRLGAPLTAMQRPLWASQRRNPTAHCRTWPCCPGSKAPSISSAWRRPSPGSSRPRRAADPGRRGAGGAPRRARGEPRRRANRRSPALMSGSGPTQRARDPSIRRRAYDSVVFRHEDGTVSWYLAMHHAITDATSSVLVFAATAVAYAGDPVGSRLLRLGLGPGERGGARLDQAAAHWPDRPAAPRFGRLYRQVAHPTPFDRRVLLPLPSDVLDRAPARLGTDYAMVQPDLAWTACWSPPPLSTCTASRADEFSIGLPVHNRGDAPARLDRAGDGGVPCRREIVDGDTFRDAPPTGRPGGHATLRHAGPGAAPSTPTTKPSST